MKFYKMKFYNMPEIIFKPLPDNTVGNITLNTIVNFAVGDVVTGGTSAATGKIIKIDSTNKILRVNALTGFFVEGETVTNTGTGTGTVATKGYDLSATTRGIEHTQWTNAGVRVRSYVLVAIRNFLAKWSDANALPSFTATSSVSALAHMVTGDILSISVSSGADTVSVATGAYINVTINGIVRKAYYTSGSSTSTSSVFKYTVVAGDVATAGQITVDTAIVGSVYDTIADGQTLIADPVTFVAPDTSTYAAN